MKNLKTLGVCAAGMLLLLGAGCAGASTPSSTGTTASTEGKMKAEVKFSEVKANVLDAQTNYREIRFSGLTGSCADKGLSSNVSYVDDAKLGYFIMKDNEGNFEDDQVSAAFTGQVHFKALTLNQDFVNCTANAVYGEDTGAVSCTDANDKAFCTGEYNVTAVPR